MLIAAAGQCVTAFLPAGNPELGFLAGSAVSAF